MRTGPIGITEGADPTINSNWTNWVREDNPAILITKAPRLLLSLLEGDENIIVHCTITGLGGTILEPRIDNPDLSLKAYHELCTMFGKEKIILRIDPIIPLWDGGYKITPGLIAKEAEGRVRISFMDQYDHVKNRFSKKNIYLPWQTFHAPLTDRKLLWEQLGNPEVCAEPGLPSMPCVSPEDCRILRVTPSTKRKGQRALCGCLANKTEICRPPPKCTYGCLYCYWKD